MQRTIAVSLVLTFALVVVAEVGQARGIPYITRGMVGVSLPPGYRFG